MTFYPHHYSNGRYFTRRQPRQLQPAHILSEVVAVIGLVILLGAMIWIAGQMYHPLGQAEQNINQQP